MNKSLVRHKRLPVLGGQQCGPVDHSAHQQPLALITNYDPTGDSVDRANWLASTHSEEVVLAFRAERIRQAARAQERDKEGFGGTCEDCGEAILHERRMVLPETTRCLRCQASFERSRQRSGFGCVRASLHDQRVAS